MGRFSDIVAATLINRFKDADLGEAQRWVNREYAWVWHQNDLTFKHVSAMENTLAVTASENTPDLPDDFADVEELLDDNGDPLEALAPDDFSARYRGDTSTGAPEAFTVVNRVLYLGPTPGTSATFYLGYRRLFAHFATDDDDVTTVVTGVMVDDTDSPLWPVTDHDELLVVGARIRGKRRAQDPTWQGDVGEREELLDALLSDYGVGALVKPSYGADLL